MISSLRRFVLFAGTAAAACLCAASPASAADLRDYCPDRPGMGTPACTIDPGHASIEVGLADWTLDRQGGTRTDDFAFGDTLVRYGLTDTLEVQAGWTAIGFERVRDGAGTVRRQTGSGDLRLALRQNLIHADGSGFSVAVMPVVSLPTGSDPLGAGTWGASLIVPASWKLPHGLQLDFTSEVDAAPDADRHGRHLAYSGVLGLDADLGHDVEATFELAEMHDEDPTGSSDQLLGGLALAWMAKPDLQVDIGTNVGLSRDAPDVELYAGVSRRF